MTSASFQVWTWTRTRTAYNITVVESCPDGEITQTGRSVRRRASRAYLIAVKSATTDRLVIPWTRELASAIILAGACGEVSRSFPAVAFGETTRERRVAPERAGTPSI